MDTEQQLIVQEVGEELLDKLINLLGGCGKAEVTMLVREKLVESIGYYQTVAPTGYVEERSLLEDKVSSLFAQRDFSQYLMEFLRGNEDEE